MKKQSNGSYPFSYGNGYVLSVHGPDAIVGSLLGILEAIGLPEKQEESIKHLIRRAVWDTFGDAIYISAKRHTEIRELHFKAKQQAQSAGNPVSEI